MKLDTPALDRRVEARSPLAAVVLLSDLDALIREAQDEKARARLRKLGFSLDGLPRLLTARNRLAEATDRRWIYAYERVWQRYGRRRL